MALQPYTAEFAAANLRPHKGEIEVGQHRYHADIQADHGWVLERGSDGERKLPIAHVLGGKNVYYFLTPGERGRLQTLPAAYDVRRQAWFDTARSGIRHFAGGTEDEPLHWTDREYTFNTSCHSCHVSQLSTNYDLQTDMYHTEWAEPGINCETCHGPGGEHVRVCREAGKGEPPQDLKIISTRPFSAAQTNAMCAPCHAKMVAVTESFRPGDRYFDHFGLITLEHPDFYPDGRDLGENYTYTSWRMSPCLRSEQFDCLHCHTSSGRFRFRDEPNRSCLPCHQERVANAAGHTHHADGSPGNECVSCHMPKTEFARMIRSDHSMRPPTPAATLAYESPNACNLCHADMDATWADRWVRQWRTRDYQAPVLRWAGLIDAARKEDWARLPEMLALLSGPECDEIHATSLVRLLRSCDDDRTWAAFIRALENPSPLVRAAAAEALGGYITRESLPALLRATRDEYRLVRVRAASALAAAPRDALKEDERRHLEAATDESIAAMQARPDDYSSHYNLGIFYSERGDYEQAVACYEMANKLEPRGIAPLVNVSIVYNLLGQNDKAEQRLRQALRIEPSSVAANLNLGMLLGELGRPREAEAAFRAALEADPKSAVAAYNLGVSVAGRDLTEAIELCRRARKFRPGEPKHASALAFYLRQAGRADEAIAELRQLVGEHPSSVDGYVMLGEFLEEQ
ncbi:MAG: tetratricopeptide repeat protein, partial [Phycisphaerales bacterium]